MKQIKILLSSALTLLLFTSNNASAAVYAKYDGIQAQQPNINTFKGQVRKGNVRKGNINAFKGQARKGNAFKRNVRILPNRIGGPVDGGRFNPISKYSISDEPAFIPKPAFRINQSNDDASGLGFRNSLEHGPGLHDSVHCINNSIKQIDGKNFACKNNNWLGPLGGDGVFSRGVNERSSVIIGDNHFKNRVIIDDNNFIGENGKVELINSFGGQEGEAFNPTSKYSISDEPAFVPKPDGALGPDVVTTFDQKTNQVWTNGNATSINAPAPGIVNDSNSGMLQKQQQTLKFIDGEWR